MLCSPYLTNLAETKIGFVGYSNGLSSFGEGEEDEEGKLEEEEEEEEGEEEEEEEEEEELEYLLG